MIKIIDWQGNVTTLENIDLNSDDILSAAIDVVTGDEILTIIDKTGHIMKYDSSSSRNRDYADGGYYIKENGIVKGFVTSEDWLNATSSYDRLDIAYNSED